MLYLIGALMMLAGAPFKRVHTRTGDVMAFVFVAGGLLMIMAMLLADR